jgi:hypothetical protein
MEERTKPPGSIFELIESENFRKRTPMFTGDEGISALESFMNGYSYATWSNDIEEKDEIIFNEFHDWVAGYFKWRESTAGWRRIILHECKGDEVKALKTFFELYDKFKARLR